jgi:hypothetical protein
MVIPSESLARIGVGDGAYEEDGGQSEDNHVHHGMLLHFFGHMGRGTKKIASAG